MTDNRVAETGEGVALILIFRFHGAKKYDREKSRKTF